MPFHDDVKHVTRLKPVVHDNFDFSGATGGPNGPQFFAGGGIVQGPPGSPQPAIVHGGEAVFTPEQLAALRAGNGAASPPVVVHVSGVVGNERAVAQRITELLTDFFKGGRKPPWVAA